MSLTRRSAVSAACALALLCTSSHAAEETRSLEELRNTVVNLLEALVQKGVMTRDQAQAMVSNAQTKAEQEAKARADQEASEKGAVRVTYVPEIVKQQIRDEVKAELRGEVTKEVVAQARQEQWGVPGALPAWVSRFTFSGDVRLRGQSDMYASDNTSATCGGLCYFDFLTINNRGGIVKAGTAAYLNTTEDRTRARVRVRLAADVRITDAVTAGVRISSGSLTDPVSTNQTLGQYGSPYQLEIDRAYLRFDFGSKAELPWMTMVGGRIANPFLSTDLVWDPDLNFEGFAATARLAFGGYTASTPNLFLTAGAFPLQEVELSSKDKWLYAGQLGIDFPWSAGSGRLRLAAAYYHFNNITGVKNQLDNNLTDFTAPKFMQKGNTLFDIRYETTPSSNLFALAAEYHLADATLSFEQSMFGHKLLLNGDYVKNIGYKEEEVLARAPLSTDGKKRIEGYQAELGFGTANVGRKGDWRAYWAYRYLQRDAVLDAFTDSDFHLGGTDAKGYTLRGEWWFRDRTWLSVRYLSSDAIDGPPLGIDTLMLDINGQF